MTRRFICWLIPLGFLATARLAAQTGAAPRLHLERVASGLGLSQNAITCLMQDRRGFLWIGTRDGLNRFDGYRFTVYRFEAFDSTSLSNNHIIALCEDRDGQIWVGTSNGLNLFDRTTEVFHRWPQSAAPGTGQGLSQALILDIRENPRDGAIWIATNEGVYKVVRPPASGRAKGLAAATYTHFRHDPHDPNSLSRDQVSSLAIDGDNAVWATTDFSIHKISPSASGRYEVSRFIPDPPNTDWKKILQRRPLRHRIGAGNNGAVWIGFDEAWIRWEASRSKYTYFILTPELTFGDVVRVYEDAHGVMWLGAFGGLGRFDPATRSFTFYRHEAGNPHSVPPSGVIAIRQDTAGVMWFGSNGNGLFRYDPQAKRFSQRRGDERLGIWQGASLRAMHETPQDGALWLSTTNGRLLRMNRQTGETRPIPPPPNFPDWSAILAMRQDAAAPEALWLGSEIGLFRIEWQESPAKRAAKISYFDPLPNSIFMRARRVIAVYQDRDHDIWIMTPLDLMRWKRGAVKSEERYRFAASNVSLFQNNYGSIHQDRRGVFWLGTSEGLLHFDPRSRRGETSDFKRYRYDPKNKSGLSYDGVLAICEDPDDPENILWLGTAGGGLNRFDMRNETFAHFTVKDGLPDMVIYAVLSDNAGHLWMSTNNGLSRFNPRTRTFKNFDVNDGLQDNEFNSASYFKSASGELFFGGINGFNAFYPEAIRDNAHVPRVALTGFELFNQPVSFRAPDSPLQAPISETQELRLRYDQNVFSFEFAALDYTDPRKNRYAYQMENFDENWREAGMSRTATYTNLDPGEYVFRVKGSNNDGVWNEEGAALRVIITPPWWRTWWAYAFYVLFFAAILYGLRRYEMNRQRLKHQVEIERLHAEKQHLETAKLQELDQLKSRFFANISHEFRTPLTLIMGQIDGVRALLAELPLKARLDVAFRNAQQLLRLINQLLDLSKLEAGRMELRAVYGNIVPLLKSLTHAFEALAQKKGIALRFQSSHDDFKIYHEPEKIEKIVHNLLSNAFKFTPEGGRISVQLSVAGGREQSAEGRGLRAEGDGRRTTSDERNVIAPQPSALSSQQLQITVRDTGIGIPREHLPHIFDRFYQVDSSATREHEGTGIGLALTKELVELHGGTLSVESEEGFGSTFVVRLPLASRIEDRGLKIEDRGLKIEDRGLKIEDRGLKIEDRGLKIEDSGLKSDEAMPSKMTTKPQSSIIDPQSSIIDPQSSIIDPQSSNLDPQSSILEHLVLLVEDNADLRAYVRENLEAQFQIMEAADGEEALAKALEQVPDLVITDVMMPKLDGYGLSKKLRGDEKTSHIPIIMLTARAEEADKIAGLEIGVDDYLTKPFSPNELRVRVRNLIELRKRLRLRFSQATLIKPSEITATPVDQKFLARIKEIVEANLEDENFSLPSLSAKAGMSERQLERKLKALIDQTPNQFIRAMRLQRAKQLLEQNAGTVSEIAYMVGFGNIPYFSKAFREAFGKPPSEVKGEG